MTKTPPLTDKGLCTARNCRGSPHSVHTLWEEGVSLFPGRLCGPQEHVGTGHMGPLLQSHATVKRYTIDFRIVTVVTPLYLYMQVYTCMTVKPLIKAPL